MFVFVTDKLSVESDVTFSVKNTTVVAKIATV